MVFEKITAREAFDAGKKRYFTGKECLNGHVAERMISNGVCVDCLAERRKLYVKQNIAHVRKLDKENHARMRKLNPEAEKLRLSRFYAKKEAKRVEEAGRERPTICDICSEEGKTVFDHCHTKGHFRGWLCDRCNKVLGLMKDNPDNIRKLAIYLENDNVKTNN